jgi:hypothetical protein
MPQHTGGLSSDVLNAALHGLEAQKQKIERHIEQVRTLLGNRADGAEIGGNRIDHAGRERPSWSSRRPATREVLHDRCFAWRKRAIYRSRTRYAMTSGSCGTPASVIVRIRISKCESRCPGFQILLAKVLSSFSLVTNSAAIS